jgi:mannose-1-phosphate guanylyltransferase
MFSVVMAGGSGTRFWPMSRKGKPKQFLKITGRHPMVVETCERLKPLSRDEEILLVLGEGHLPEAEALFKGRQVRLIGEPCGRNTAAAMGLGAVYARHLGYRGPLAFLPADHHVASPGALIEALKRAEKAAEPGGIVTLGIVPVRPETGYGYIRRKGPSPDPESSQVYRVQEFVEKPDLETARRYLASGEYYWNAGIFVATPEVILREMRTHLPRLYEGMMRVSESLGGSHFDGVLAEVYAGLESVSFDYGIMERTKEEVYVIPCDCGWSDVGSWLSLYDLRASDRDEDLNLANGDALLLDCRESFVTGGGGDRLVACLGLRRCLVVDTPDILLVADLDRAQDIRRVVETLKQKKRDQLL